MIRLGPTTSGNPMFEPEYADVLGIPFSFIPANSAPDYKPPKKQTRIEAVDGREAQEIRFPRMLGYRVVLPPGRLKATFSAESRLTIDPGMAPSEAINAPIVGRSSGSRWTISVRSARPRLPFMSPNMRRSAGSSMPTASRSRGCSPRCWRSPGAGWMNACMSHPAPMQRT